MRLDTANRSFLALIALAAVPYALLGLGACGLVSAFAYRFHTGGWDAVTSVGDNIWPGVALLGVVAVGTGLGAASLTAQARATRRLRARLRALRLPVPATLRDAAFGARLPGRVDLIDSAERFSFAYGLLLPRVAVSRGLFEGISDDELDAVLAHERYHVRARDPAKVMLARAVSRALFFLPALRHLRGRYVAGRELAADRRAVRACGRVPVAGALAKVLAGPRWPEMSAAAAIGGPDLLGVRVEQLETGREPPIPRVSRAAAVTTAAGIAALAGLIAASFLGLDDPFAFVRDHWAGRALDHRHAHGWWDVAGFGLTAAAWGLGGWWLLRRFRFRS